jgi:hypothetical protein
MEKHFLWILSKFLSFLDSLENLFLQKYQEILHWNEDHWAGGNHIKLFWKCHDNQHNDSQHSGTQHNNKNNSILSISKLMLSMVWLLLFSVSLCCVILPSIVMLSVTLKLNMLSVTVKLNMLSVFLMLVVVPTTNFRMTLTILSLIVTLQYSA